MNITVFVIGLFVLQLLCLIIGRMASRNNKDQDDYFLAGRTVRFFPLMMTFVATQIGGGLVLGAAEEAYSYGLYVLLYPLGASLGLLLLAMGIGKRLSEFKVSTVAQLFEVIYKSSNLKKIASILSVISLFMIMVAQIIASKKFISSLGIEYETLIFVGFWGIVIVYTVLGGLRAVVASDIIQALFFIGVFLICFVYTYFNSSPIGDITKMGFGDNFAFDSGKLTGWLIMPLLFMVIEQDMAQRCFAGASGKVVSWACGASALCVMIVCFIPVYYGILANNMGIEAHNGSSILMNVVIASTNPVLAALMGCAIMAAIISTAESLLNAISSNITQDFDLSFLPFKKLRSSQIITAITALASIFVSYYFNNVVDLLILSYEISVCCLFVPIFAALFVNDGNKISAIGSISLGLIGFVLFRLFPIWIPTEIASLLLSLLGYLVGEVIARNKLSRVE